MAAAQAGAGPGATGDAGPGSAPGPALHNGTERAGKRASSPAGSNAPPSPAAADYAYRYAAPARDYYRGYEVSAPAGGKPRAQRFFPGGGASQAPGPTPTLNSLLQGGAGGGASPGPGPAHRAPYPPPPGYEQPPPAQPYPGPGWGPPRATYAHAPPAPYAQQPYRNSTPPAPGGGRGPGPGPGAGYGPGGYPGAAPGAPAQQPPAGYGPAGYQRYPPPGQPGAPRPPYSPHQGYERGGSPQPLNAPHSPGGAGGLPPGALSPSHDPHHPPAHPAPHPHQGYPPRPPQPSTPNAHDPESDLTGQNSNDSSGGSGGAGARATTPHLRPTPSPTGSSGSRSMSPAVGQQSVPMPPRPSSSQSDGSGPASRPPPAAAAAAAPPAPAPAPAQHPPGMAAQPYPPHHAYKPPHAYGAPPHQYPYPPRNHHPYPYQGYRPPPPPQHYLKQPHLGHKHMGPPAPQHHGDGAMPPPTPPDAPHAPHAPHAPDNGPAPSVTSLVTTGPDGAPLDEGSQQSTLSNASAASGEESACTTPKPRKDGAYAGAAPSPGTGSHPGAHEDYDASPSSWPRPPSSPVFNSHVPQEAYRSKKSDSLGKLYEMDDSPERRGWVERLLAFMEERRTPIAACPTISKQPLDLYRLYLLVRERGGFVEVTKNKTWKDIAGLLGIGASSSAAYTLRKHYTKNLLAYECHFDRGGIDPQPIINQVEASTKKKNNKANSSPSPGTSNTQESFTGGGAAAPGAPMENYGGQYGAYPPQQNQQQGSGAAGDNNLAASNPFDEIPPGPRRPPGYPAQQGYGYEYGSPYQSNRPVYPPYGPEGDRGYGGGGNEAYRYGGGYGGRYPAPGAPPPAGTPPPPGQPYPDYYRPQHPPAPSAAPNQPAQHESPSPSVNIMNSQLARQLVAPLSPGTKPYHHYGGGKGQMPPPAAGGQPRRHPDFASKEGAAYGAGGGAPGPAPPRAGAPQPYAPWAGPPGPAGQFPRAPAAPAQPPGAPGAPGAWRPPPGSQPPQQWPPSPYQPPGQPGAWPAGASGPGAAPGAPRPGAPGAPPRASPAAPSPAAPYLRPDGKPYPNQPQPPPGTCSSLPASQVKRELMFPLDTVEATAPLAEKRRRLTRADVAPVDAWRIMMALKSGLLAETCWALDILNILLFDDSCIGYFGLQHMPGLLDLLLEHFQKSLSDVFEGPQVEDEPWFAPAAKSEPEKVAPQEKPPPDPEDRLSLLSGENYTLESRRGRSVTYRTKDDDLFAPDPSDTDEERVEDSVLESWQFGGDTSFSNHVMPCFQGEFVHIPFTRVIPGGGERAPPERERAARRDEGKAERTESASERSADPSPRVKFEEEAKEEPPERTNGGEDCDNLEAEPMEIERDSEEAERKPVLQVRDPAGTLKRRRLSDYEDECYTRDEPSLNLVRESREALAKRCIALSNILRGLTFVPGNEQEFSRNSGFLALAGKLLLLHHEHAPRAARARAYERAARDEGDADACCSSLHGAAWWWWDTLAQLRSDALVCCANIAGSVELAGQPEAVARPLLDGLLHWCVCPAAAAEDAPPHASPASPLSPRRLALEALCKLCVTDANVDLVLATPPRTRLRALCGVLARNLCRQEEQVLREFSVNLLHYLASAESGAARQVALQAPAVGQLVAFIERAEQAALGVANQHGVGALRDNPDAMGTSLDMLRRAASTLLRLAEHPHNRPLFLQQERRLLSLVMSQILDQKVAQELSKVLYQCSRPAHSPRHQDPA